MPWGICICVAAGGANTGWGGYIMAGAIGIGGAMESIGWGGYAGICRRGTCKGA